MQKLTLFASLLLASSPLFAQTLLVANQKDHTLSLIDPATNLQIAAIDVAGVTGHEVVASPDGRTAFVPLYGSSGVGKPGTDGQKIDVIDLAQRKIIHTIDFPHGVRPHFPAFSPNGKILYVTSELDKTITEIDPKTYAFIGTIPTTQAQSHMFIVAHDGRRAYTANVEPGSVSVLDLASKKVLAVIPISPNTQRISISNDDAMVFTSDQSKSQIAVIDTATNKIKTWIPIPSAGYGTASTRDGRYLLVCLRAINKLGVIDLKTMQLVRTIDTPGSPQEVLVRPDGKTAYASCQKKVAVVDITNSDVAKWTIPTAIEAGNGADGLAWAR